MKMVMVMGMGIVMVRDKGCVRCIHRIRQQKSTAEGARDGVNGQDSCRGFRETPKFEII